ncbi:RDD family protein [Moraxella catarrhalis]|uniref:RDD family protein n=1 Tax=Moraxella catarrhalis TaxID=480 RepID=UPI000EA927A3|nr:RDD family protein [Moraxella catarrhalis]RKM35725.1 RDD family protein [Moraxella catarrhalis]
MKIYLARNQVQAGPYTLEELNTMLASGEVWLDDLIWHSPMTAWQRLGDLTQNQSYYQPNNTLPPKPATLAEIQHKNKTRGFGDNVDFHPDRTQSTDKPKRISVDELYGKKPVQSPANPNDQPSSRTSDVAISQNTQAVLATIGSRFMAVMINFVLFMLALMPFLQQFMVLNPDPVLLNTGDFETRMAYAQELATQIPAQTMTLSSILIAAYLIIQLILIIARAQSFGKLVAGIRTVDTQTLEKPNFFKRFVLRVVVLFFIYQLASALPIAINMALILLMINYIMAARSPIKQGWHDKLAGTIVVKTSEVKFKKKSDE